MSIIDKCREQDIKNYDDRTHTKTTDELFTEEELRLIVYRIHNSKGLPSALANRMCINKNLVEWYDECDSNFTEWKQDVEFVIRYGGTEQDD